MTGSLAPDVVLPLLHGRFGRGRYVHEEVTASTQRLVGGDDAEGAIAVADEQTDGRGRLGRAWVAPRRSSVMFSLVLRPKPPVARWPELTLVAGRAVADAVRALGVEPTVKHPNDVLVGGRKLAGILAEARDGVVVLGVGINVAQDASQLPDGATSLRLEGVDVSRAELLAAVLVQLERAYDAWNR